MENETGKEMFEIEAIIDKDAMVKRGKSITKYIVRWKGYKAEEDSWLTYSLEDPEWMQDQKLVDDRERTRATDLDTKDVQAKVKGRGAVSSVAVRAKGSLGIVAKRGRGTKTCSGSGGPGAGPGSLGTVPEERVLGGRGLSSGMGPGATIRVVEPDLERIRVVEPDLGIEAGREGFRDSLSLKVEQNEELVVEDGLQASGGVKVVRLKVNSTLKMGSENSMESDWLKPEA
jgi:hypothetical protein